MSTDAFASTALRRPALRLRLATITLSGVWAMCGLAALTVALRAPFARVPLGIDEGGLAFVSHAWGSAGDSLYGPYWIDRPPLLLGLFKVAGLAGPLGIRLLGAAAAAALVAVAYRLGRAVAGNSAALITGLLTAVMASSAALLAVFTPSELLASVPAAGSVLCLLTSRDGGPGRLVAAGALATSALLIKQSFLDAGVAGIVFLAATGLTRRRFAARDSLAYLAGAAAPLLGVGLWILVAPHQAGQLGYALIGFRVAGLHALAGSSIPLPVRMQSLLLPALGSGLALALAAAPLGLRRVRTDHVLALTLAAWIGAGAFGVLAGGSYWSHYLIQLVVPAALLTALAFAAAGRHRRRLVVAAIVVVALATNTARAIRVDLQHPVRSDIAAADYVRAHARPGDTQYVMYARANVDYYAALPSPFPYAWSLMMRTIPGAPAQLGRVLDSAQRPTWIVGWQAPDAWGLDPHGTLAADLEQHYRVAAVIGGHPIYHALPTSRTPNRSL
ncbi:MAG: hypothetical protein QOH46_4126 [Solirubrobacteraceae bacterium]|nr:hypothetical protein [Solirubrobacteraceae bacterium]